MKTYWNARVFGWTLVEIMIVVSIIGILLGLATPKVIRAHQRAKIAQAEADLERIAAAVEELAWDTGLWPGGITRTDRGSGKPANWDAVYSPNWTNEIDDLTTPMAGLIYEGHYFSNNNWKGPYIHKIEKDPWGSHYFFDSDYTPYKKAHTIVAVGSMGPNKNIVGGSFKGVNAYDNDDIYIAIKTRDTAGE